MKTNEQTVTEIPMDEIESRYAPGVGRHWFDPETMRYFRTRLPEYGFEGVGGCYFVSSEKGPHHNSPRSYTVRQLVGEGRVATIGEFCGHSTRAQATREAKRLAMGGI